MPILGCRSLLAVSTYIRVGRITPVWTIRTRKGFKLLGQVRWDGALKALAWRPAPEAYYTVISSHRNSADKWMRAITRFVRSANAELKLER
jgi:hypothetical protein